MSDNPITPQGWMPIETAPKNKTHVALLAVRSDGSVTYGHGYYMPLEGWRCWTPKPYIPPTHWFPLPDPFGFDGVSPRIARRATLPPTPGESA